MITSDLLPSSAEQELGIKNWIIDKDDEHWSSFGKKFCVLTILSIKPVKDSVNDPALPVYLTAELGWVGSARTNEIFFSITQV